MKRNLYNRVIQIAGSCSRDTNIETINFSHELVQSLVQNLLESGINIVSTVGNEEKLNPDDPTSSPIIFYWDILEVAYNYAKSKSFSEDVNNIVKVISSEKLEEDIPEDRKELWREIISKGVVSLTRIKTGWNSGAIKRQKQETISDALLILGGGAGVEHSAHLHVSHGKPVLPLDIPLGSSCNDGIGGASYYSRLAIVEPKKFILNAKVDTASKLANLEYKNWSSSPESYANAILEFLENIIEPQVFYIRLLDEVAEEYHLVESYFRDVVDVVVKTDFRIKEIGRSETTEAFLNVEIFKEINNSSVIIADLTGLRLNCFMEMGFAFGLNKKVLVTAKKGTTLPFDTHAIPCHFWDPLVSVDKQQESFIDFWVKSINRPLLVSSSEIV